MEEIGHEIDQSKPCEFDHDDALSSYPVETHFVVYVSMSDIAGFDVEPMEVLRFQEFALPVDIR